MTSLKNFAITFCIALVLFGVIALILSPMAVRGLGGTTSDEEVPVGADTQEAEQSGEKKKIDLSGVKGESFTALLIGVDYLPDSRDNYNAVFDSSVVSYGEPQIGSGSLLSEEDIADKYLTYNKQRVTTCDSIMLVQFNRERQAVSAISIPGNTRVLLDGNNVSLGRVLPKKGIAFFCEKIEALTGLHVDHYMLLTPKLFVNVINTLGGVPFEVPQDMYYEDPVEKLEISISQGKQTLSGQTALSMLRYVGYADGDLGRMKLARTFVHSLFSQLNYFTASASAADRFSAIIPFIYSDMHLEDFLAVQDLVFCYDDFVKEELTYPGQQVTLANESYYEPDVATATEMFLEYRLAK